MFSILRTRVSPWRLQYHRVGLLSTASTSSLSKDQVAAMVLTAKKKKELGWAEIAAKLGKSPVWTHSAAIGMNSMPPGVATRFAKLLDLPSDVIAVLSEYPTKNWAPAVPTDPVLYRLYEIVGVYGPSIKELMHEEFGDGIMSAIDFDMHLSKVKDPKGDRVKIEMTGKFLKYNVW